MSMLELGFLSFPVLLLMIFLRAPIGLAMLLAGIGGLWFATGDTNMFMSRLKTETYGTFSSYSLTIIPMFLLMGQFATLSGMSQALFKAAESFLGHRKGGVAMAAVGACAGFGSICGSSLATAATMSRVALPELRRYGYSGGFSTATLAAGGTLGILIPPVGHPRDLCDPDRAKHREAFSRGLYSGDSRSPRLYRNDFDLCARLP